MCKTVAVVSVQSEKVFAWLGHMPVLNWCLTRLEDVRNVDQVVCVTAKAFTRKVRELVDTSKIDVVEIPADVANATVGVTNGRSSTSALENWLCSANGPGSDADVIAVIGATNPFLPAGTIEDCIDSVIRKFADLCCTTQEVNAWTPYGKTTGHAELLGCRVFAPARVKEPYSKFRPVHIGTIESLDVTDATNLRLAKAAVEDGIV